MRFASVCLVCIAAGQAGAQEPVSYDYAVETGWTSNATDSAAGGEDFYLRHDHRLEIAGGAGPLSLRGGLWLEQTRHARLVGEDDLEAGAGIEASLEPGEGVALRLGYAATRSWIGEVIAGGGMVIELDSGLLEQEVLAELVLLGDGRQLTLAVDRVSRQPGETVLVGLPLPPLRLDPAVEQVRVRLDAELALGPDLVALARLHGFFTGVPPADQADHGREPADAARLAGGLRWRGDAMLLEARGGVDLVWPENAPQLLQGLSYLDAMVELAALEALTVSGRAMLGIELVEPVDGVAGRVAEAELGARLALGERVALTGALSLRGETGLFLPDLRETRRSASAGVTVALAGDMSVGVLARASRTEAPDTAYDTMSLALTFGGRL